MAGRPDRRSGEFHCAGRRLRPLPGLAVEQQHASPPRVETAEGDKLERVVFPGAAEHRRQFERSNGAQEDQFGRWFAGMGARTLRDKEITCDHVIGPEGEFGTAAVKYQH